MRPTLEDQIRAFAARNVGDDRGQVPPDDAVVLLAAEPPRRSRKGWLVAGAVALVLVVVAGIALWGSAEDEGSDVFTTTPGAELEPAVVIVARSATAQAARWSGTVPAEVRVVATMTGGSVARDLAPDTCPSEVKMVVVEFRWEEPVLWPFVPGAATPDQSDDSGSPDGTAPMVDRSGMTDVAHYVQTGFPTGRPEDVGCDGSVGSYGWPDEAVDLDALGQPVEVAVDDPLLLLASENAIDRSRTMRRLPTSAEAVVTSPDEAAAAGLDVSCASSDEVVVLELRYAADSPDYRGPPITARFVESSPITFGLEDGCATAGGAPFLDLAALGTPMPLDLGR